MDLRIDVCKLRPKRWDDSLLVARGGSESNIDLNCRHSRQTRSDSCLSVEWFFLALECVHFLRLLFMGKWRTIRTKSASSPFNWIAHVRAGYVKHDSHIHSHIHVHTSPHQPDNDLQVREARSAMMGGVEDFDALWRNAVAPHRRRWRFRSSAMLFFFISYNCFNHIYSTSENPNMAGSCRGGTAVWSDSLKLVTSAAVN